MIQGASHDTLDGKVAIITGGAGGLGAAVVTTFLGAGARVIVPVEKDGDLDTLRERAHIPPRPRWAERAWS